jgi:hypothetical protein
VSTYHSAHACTSTLALSTALHPVPVQYTLLQWGVNSLSHCPFLSTGGCARTILIACVGADESEWPATFKTMQWAARVRSIRNIISVRVWTLHGAALLFAADTTAAGLFYFV